MFICVDSQHLEDLWRDARWMVVLQSARYKHQSSGVSLGWIIDFSKESIPEKPASTSSQVDYLPSPTPSPESTRKHSGERAYRSQNHQTINQTLMENLWKLFIVYGFGITCIRDSQIFSAKSLYY